MLILLCPLCDHIPDIVRRPIVDKNNFIAKLRSLADGLFDFIHEIGK